MCRVLNFGRSFWSGYPGWFVDTVHKKTFYHKEMLLYFDFVLDEKRFADGCGIFCKKCGKPVASRADYADELSLWIVTKAFCVLGCWSYWSLPVEPFWVRVLEDWR